jgi:hypothetical protein
MFAWAVKSPIEAALPVPNYAPCASSLREQVVNDRELTEPVRAPPMNALQIGDLVVRHYDKKKRIFTVMEYDSDPVRVVVSDGSRDSVENIRNLQVITRKTDSDPLSDVDH